jgi:hypothetical protein
MTSEIGREAEQGQQRGLDVTLEQLDVIVAAAHSHRSPIGIFPAMYRSVTAEIRDAVHGGFFANNTTMEHLAVVFADRYLDALALWTRGERPTRSWMVAFEAATDGRRRMIVQHLLAGMNAHINLDLGIVAAQISGDDPDHVYADFLRVNEILFQKLNGLQDTLGTVSSRMAWVDTLGGRLDERLMTLAIKDARDAAWDLAESLIADPDHTERLIEERDIKTAELGATIVGGVMPVRFVSRFVARSEPTDVRDVIDAFSQGRVDLDEVEVAVASQLGEVEKRP